MRTNRKLSLKAKICLNPVWLGGLRSPATLALALNPPAELDADRFGNSAETNVLARLNYDFDGGMSRQNSSFGFPLSGTLLCMGQLVCAVPQLMCEQRRNFLYYV